MFSVAPPAEEEANDEEIDHPDNIASGKEDFIVAKAFATTSVPEKSQPMIEDTEEPNPQEEVDCWNPKRLLATHSNSDGVRCCTVVFSLTCGNRALRSDGAEIAVPDDGWSITLAEKWSNFVLDTELFHNNFPDDNKETEDDKMHRKFAMMDTIQQMKENCDNDVMVSRSRQRLPFHVKACEMREEFIASPAEEERHHVHVDAVHSS